ncbi:MAG: pseudaminic acid cytidylyltransferase [Proteobacteria bacterium]|nr:pseudaminic acid cytidylyltransferase [Pseudomonadota bacterium]
MSETVALIPARGGSKRIHRKNVRNFHGRPIIAWSIGAAQHSELFDHIIVSTDDDEIAEVARKEGAEVPFLRPAEFADDNVGITPVVQHAIQEMHRTGILIRELCLIYATAPFVRSSDLKKGQAILRSEHCDYVIAVTTYPFPIQRSLKKTVDGRLAMFQPEHFNSRSQDLEPAYHDAAHFCWGTAEAWMGNRCMYGPNTVPFMLPRHLVQDIDCEEDWVSAEWLFRVFKDNCEV